MHEIIFILLEKYYQKYSQEFDQLLIVSLYKPSLKFSLSFAQTPLHLMMGNSLREILLTRFLESCIETLVHSTNIYFLSWTFNLVLFFVIIFFNKLYIRSVGFKSCDCACLLYKLYSILSESIRTISRSVVRRINLFE